jgi:4-diphosphocytidyl-2-C-methyl-D-erythritol kinase
MRWARTWPPMADAGRWRLVAPAKLNLWLHVTGRRADGYHELASLFVLLELADTLEMEAAADGVVLSLDGPHAGDVPADGDNLALRGWDAGRGGQPPGASLRLSKAIPVAAGLGGGSSDAAAAWRLGSRSAGVADEPPDAPTLVALAEIGADVPFFAAQVAAARVTGIGEQVEAAASPDAREVVLVHPPFGLSTADVFGSLLPGDWSEADPALGSEPAHNDLLAAARRIRPEIDDVLRIVTAAGGEPRLTGSGPTVFTLTADAERSAFVAERVARSGLAVTETRVRAEPASIEPW